ncbi:MAG: TraC family protein [Selenomonadales bacterium]|nr:TraC family protein [Selenomonadales bacterium]
MKLLALRKRKKDPTGTAASVREWLPVEAIDARTIKRKDGTHAALIRVMPVNMSLRSEGEKKRAIAAWHEALNGIKAPLQIFALGRPIDLDAYLRRLTDKAQEEGNPTRKKLLREYSRYVAGVASGGETAERRFYVLLTAEDAAHAVSAAHELATSLNGAGLTATMCDGQEILEVLFSFFNPDKAATERVGAAGSVLPPIYS